jgi:hypothetical protein
MPQCTPPQHNNKKRKKKKTHEIIKKKKKVLWLWLCIALAGQISVWGLVEV